LENIALDRNGAIRTITIDRPQRRNAMTYSMLAQLGAAIADVGKDRAARVLILTGAGDDFCSGADLRGGDAGAVTGGPAEYFLDLDGDQRAPHRLTAQIFAWGRSISLALTQLSIPTLAAVRGVAMGPGFSLVLACDLAFATETARLSSMWIRRGLVPSFGDLWLLPRMVGHRRALAHLLSGEVLSGVEAKDIGIVNEVFGNDEALQQAVVAWGEGFASGPSVAYGLLKREVYKGLEQGFQSALESTAFAEAHNVLTADVTEAFVAFRESRPPRFRGR
jgi:2-(1,2-epoxy-1,2-dihydrophenyl)acetyl-CoA isomerase